MNVLYLVGLHVALFAGIFAALLLAAVVRHYVLLGWARARRVYSRRQLRGRADPRVTTVRRHGPPAPDCPVCRLPEAVRPT